MLRLWGVALLTQAALLTSVRAETLTHTTDPSPVVLDDRETALIELRGLPGSGRVMAVANVGRLEPGPVEGARVRLRYRLPSGGFPRVACLLLWREGMQQPAVLRVPLHGRAVLPIRTRPHAQVTIRVAGREFGPTPSDRRGRLSMEVLVPPGVTEARAVAVDARGLRRHKTVRVRLPEYNELALLVRRVGSSRFAITVAVAEASPAAVVLEAVPRRGSPVAVPLAEKPDGRWTASWTAPRGREKTDWELRAWLPEAPGLQQTAAVTVEPLPVVRARTRPLPAPRERSTPRTKKILLWSGVSLSVALLAAGVATGQIASNQSAEYRDPNTPVARRRDLDASAGRLSTASIVCLAGGAAVGVGTALYYWLGYRERRVVAGVPVPGGIVAVWSGGF
jgi:hypothetical protein